MKQKFIEWFTKNNNGCSPAMEDDRSFVRENTQHMFEAYQAGVAEGEARCAALAAEIQSVKAAALGEIEVINRGGQAYCVKDGMSVNSIYARGWNDYRAKALSVETPATSAFLAEVRAQGVEMCSAEIQKQTWDEREGEGMVAAIDAMEIYAALLRKGVQS
ncbi:TPA: hypothetical protein ACOEGF_001734 [Enterobacter asburiae]